MGNMAQKVATLRGAGLVHDNIFNEHDIGNRDNCYEPYIKLQKAFSLKNIQLHTADLNSNRPVDFEIHMNALNHPSENAYLLKLETETIHPLNGVQKVLAQYKMIFTWDDALVDQKRIFKINYPNPWTIPKIDGFAGRDRLCCLIAGNKSVRKYDERELYTERVRSIRWFESNATQEFDLYGNGWQLPASRHGLFGRAINITHRLTKPILHYQPFPSYRGKIENKNDVLKRTRYAVCYENVRDLKGYITEKIFDCFFSGCVPIYWGAVNISEYIPPACFIDRRNFKDTHDVYRFIKDVDEERFLEYQENIVKYLTGKGSYSFGIDQFCETITSRISSDLSA